MAMKLGEDEGSRCRREGSGGRASGASACSARDEEARAGFYPEEGPSPAVSNLWAVVAESGSHLPTVLKKYFFPSKGLLLYLAPQNKETLSYVGYCLRMFVF